MTGSNRLPPRPLRIIEVSEGIAGAVCGRLFAGLGHDVVRIAADDADALRYRPPLNDDGVSLHHVTLHAGKRTAAAARLPELVRDLLPAADVLLLDVAPSRAAALGLGTDDLLNTHPALVIVAITGFGVDSDLSELPQSSLLAESYGGLTTMIGEAGRRPLTLGGEQTAHCGAVVGFLGAMLALLRRDHVGGDLVDVALCDVAAYMDWKSDVSFFMTGTSPARAVRDDGDWRLVRAADGWIGFIFLPRHWPAVVELIDHPALRAADLAEEAVRNAQPERWWPVVERWAAVRPAEEIYRRAQEHGLPFGWVVRVSDLLASDQLRSRGFVNTDPAVAPGRVPVFGAPLGAALPWDNAPAVPAEGPLRWLRRPDGDDGPHPSLIGDPNRPLAGITVLDFGTITAGAAVTRLLADHGAQILKVEWSDRPDTFRTWKLPEAQTQADRSLVSPYFPSNNVGKLDVAIDLKAAGGRDVVRQFARHADVVVENFRVGVTSRLGIDAATLRSANDDLLYLSLSSQGQLGPEAGNRSFGSTLDLLSGLAAQTGYPDSGPMWSSYEVNYPDQLVSLVGAAAVAYCVHQGITATTLDVSQREVVSWTLAVEAADYLVNGRDSATTGNTRPGFAPHDTFATAGPDEWVAISCANDAQRRALAGWLGRADRSSADVQWWSTDEAYDLVAAAALRHTRADLVGRLGELGVPTVPVLSAEDRAQTPRFEKRRVIVSGDGPPVKGFPMVFRRYDPQATFAAPAIGEHTTAVLTDVVGVSADELARLEADGVIRSMLPGAQPGHGRRDAREEARPDE